MISLATDCKDCMHREVCQYKSNAKVAMERLKSLNYPVCGVDLPDHRNCNWEVMARQEHINIIFSCPYFKKIEVTIK